MRNTEENCEMIWKKCEMIWKIWRKSKLNSEKIGKYGRNKYPEQQQQPYTPQQQQPPPPPAAAAPTTTTTAAAAIRLLENLVEATTIVQNFVLLLVENVV